MYVYVSEIISSMTCVCIHRMTSYVSNCRECRRQSESTVSRSKRSNTVYGSVCFLLCVITAYRCCARSGGNYKCDLLDSVSNDYRRRCDVRFFCLSAIFGADSRRGLYILRLKFFLQRTDIAARRRSGAPSKVYPVSYTHLTLPTIYSV